MVRENIEESLTQAEKSQTTMLEGLFLAIASAVFSYVIEYLEPAEQIKKWLRREPAMLAFQKALSRSYTAFARQYPEYTASLFDQSFLAGAGAPELAKLLTRHLHPDPALFAQTWGASIGFDIHSPFCKEAIKPAADFLKWLEAELKSETVLQSIFDSRALESLPNLESQIEKLTTELKRGFDTALKTANDYEKTFLEIDGDVKDANIVLGDHNQISVSKIYNHYHTGAFATLSDYYIPPDAVFQRVRVDEFVGRDWLTAKVDYFLNDSHNKSGVFLLVGEAGVGKTSFMAHLVKKRRYLHLFAEQTPGDANLQRALQSLGSQLVTRYQINPYKDRDTLIQLSAFPDFLDKLLRLAANTLAKDEKIVIVCDALDEAGTAPDGNVFGLPNVLPDNVYFILSQRPVSTKLPNIDTQTTTLEAQGSENLQDMQDYLKAVTKRPEIAGQLRSKNYSDEFFVRTLQEKSLGVWMYLHYILEEVAKGSRAPLELENLPTGLVGYYADYWSDWREGGNGRGDGIKQWDDLYAPLLTTLAVAQQPITIEQIMAWAGIHTSEREVLRLLQEYWRSFLTIRESENGKTYKPYHASFKDFLTGNVDISQLRPGESYLVQELAEQSREAHKRIVKIFEAECKGDWQVLVEQDYPRLHITTHLAGAGEFETLKNILTKGDENIVWAEARYQKEETYAGFINDLKHVWEFAQGTKNLVLLIRCMLIENSIHSLAGNIPIDLFPELAKAGIWSYPRCLTVIKQISDSHQQAQAIRRLAPNMPKTLLEQTLSLAHEIDKESDRAIAFAALVPYINDELKLQLLTATREIKDESARTTALAALALHLNGKLKEASISEAISTAHEIEIEYPRVIAFVTLAPQLNNELKAQVISEAIFAARKIKDESSRIGAFAALAPYLNDELKIQLYITAHEIEHESDRAHIFVALAPYINDTFKILLLTHARKIKKESDRISVFVALTPHLNDALKGLVISEAFTTALEIKDDSDRVDAFVDLAPLVNDELKLQLLVAAREIEDEFLRVEVYAALAPLANDELKLQLLVITREIKNEFDRAHMLSTLAPYINGDLKTHVVLEALSAARKIKDEFTRATTLAELAPYLNDEFQLQLLVIAREFENKYSFTSTITVLAPYLNDELKALVISEIISNAREIKDEIDRAFAFIELTPLVNDELKEQVVSEALSATQEIEDETQRAENLAKIVPHLKDELKLQLLSISREIENQYPRVNALAALIPHLNEKLQAQVISEALTTARELKDDSDRVHALVALAPHLNDELKEQIISDAITTALEIKEEFDRVNAFVALAPHLNNKLKLQLLTTTQEIKNESDRVRVFAGITPRLNDELKLQLLFAIGKIKKKSDCANALAALAPYLNDELKTQVISEALSTTHKIKEKSERVQALVALAPHFEVKTKIVLLTEALLSNGGYTREIIEEWKSIKYEGLEKPLIEFVRKISLSERENGLEYLIGIIPSLVHFEGKKVAGEILHAIRDTAHWWP